MVFGVSAVGASAAFAHDGKLYGPHDLWTKWSWEPGVIIYLVLSAWLYVRGVRSLWRASAVGHGIRRWEVTAFGIGWLALWVALISPLHTLGSMLFSAHMLQHEILMVVAAPLLVLGRPLIAWVWGLPLAGRHKLGRLSKWEWVQRGWHMLTNPLLAWSLHAVALRKGQALPQRQWVKDGQRRTAQRLYGAVERMLIGGLLAILVSLPSGNGDVAREAT
jgi:putative membrane protein